MNTMAHHNSKGRSPMDVLGTMSLFGKKVAEDNEGSYDWERDMTRAIMRVKDLVDASNALELRFVEADGTPAHWTFNTNAARRFLRALSAVQLTQ